MASFKRLVVPVLLFVVIVGGGFTAYYVADLGQGAAAQGDGQTIANETHIQQVDMWQLVDRSTNEYTTGFNDTVVVRNNSSHVLTAGEDYRWNDTEGTIFFEDTASTNDGEPYNITYTYFANTEEVRQLDGPLDVITRGLGLSAYLVGGIALVVFLLALAGLIGKYLGGRGGPRSNR